jgi:hypothetical protein
MIRGEDGYQETCFSERDGRGRRIIADSTECRRRARPSASPAIDAASPALQLYKNRGDADLVHLVENLLSLGQEEYRLRDVSGLKS